MSKKTMRIITIVATVIFCIMIAVTSFAVETKDIDGKAKIDTKKLGNAGNTIATIIRSIGIVAAVIVLMILGIKYMMGSAEEKAEYKKTMIPYIVGAVVLFGASAIAGAIVDMANDITA